MTTKVHASGNTVVVSTICHNCDIVMKEITTDSNASLLLHSRNQYPKVAHTTDLWHCLRNFSKNNAKVRPFEIL